LRFCYG